MAQQSNSWTSKEPVVSSPAYSFVKIKDAINLFESEEAYLLNYFQNQEISPLEVWYEDVVSDPLYAIKDVISFAGLKADGGNEQYSSAYEKQATEMNMEWRNIFLDDDKSEAARYFRGT
jgi:LPS sulfotransferase NodH